MLVWVSYSPRSRGPDCFWGFVLSQLQDSVKRHSIHKTAKTNNKYECISGTVGPKRGCAIAQRVSLLCLGFSIFWLSNSLAHFFLNLCFNFKSLPPIKKQRRECQSLTMSHSFSWQWFPILHHHLHLTPLISAMFQKYSLLEVTDYIKHGFLQHSFEFSGVGFKLASVLASKA